MNDFTKKELIALEDAMEHQLEKHPPQNGKSNLLEKLQAMLNNYCDHEHEPFPQEICCIKCQRTLI